MQIWRERLPQGHSYVLKVSKLQKALNVLDLSFTKVKVFFVRAGEYKNPIFCATFSPAGSWPKHPFDSHLAIHIYSVPNHEAAEKRLYITNVMLPKLVSWLKNIMPLHCPTAKLKQAGNFSLKQLNHSGKHNLYSVSC